MTALRNGLRAGLGLLLMASMFAVPMLTARAGGSYSMTVDHDAPDGPDPVTVNFDASFDVKVTNNSGSPQTIEIDATTDGPGFITWYKQDKWNCEPVIEGGPLRTTIVHASDLGKAGQVDCTTVSDVANSDSIHLHLVARAPSGAPNTLGVSVLLLNTKSSPVTDQVDVVAQTGDDASGFIPADGGKIKTDGKPTPDDDTNSVIRTLNGSGPGGVFDLHDLQPGDPDFEEICGNHDCDGKIVEVDIPDGYNNKQNPPKLKIVYDETVAGAGEDATIWIKKDGQDPEVVPACDVDGIAKPHPCHGPAHVKKNGDIRYVVYLLSGDPLCGKH
jgi:hypothetical protein